MSEAPAQKDVRARYGVPGDLGLRVEGREVLAWLAGHEVDVREVAAHPDSLPFARSGGRRPLRRLERAGSGNALLVREYAKGGLLRHVRGRAFHGRWRPLEELVLHRRLLALGVPVPEAVGCVVLRGVFGWRGFLLLEEVRDATDLEEWLHREPASWRERRRKVLRDAGCAVRRLHDAGVPHPDLHPKNLLLAPDGRVLLLDLDKARSDTGLLSVRARLENLVRLGRAVEKHRRKGMRVGRREALLFLEGYAGSLDAARVWLARITHRLRRSLWLRALWWRLIGATRPWRPPLGEDA